MFALAARNQTLAGIPSDWKQWRGSFWDRFGQFFADPFLKRFSGFSSADFHGFDLPSGAGLFRGENTPCRCRKPFFVFVLQSFDGILVFKAPHRDLILEALGVHFA